MNLLIIALASTNANTVIENKIGNANSMYAAKTAEDRRQGGESLILLREWLTFAQKGDQMIASDQDKGGQCQSPQPVVILQVSKFVSYSEVYDIGRWWEEFH